MKPILMDDTKTLAELAQDQTNGLGRLDCLKAECNEVANGAYTVTLVYPVSGQHFNDLHYGGIIKVKPNDTADLQLFRIKKISKPMNGKIEIQCQHITYDLAKTSVLPFSAIGAQATCAGIKQHLVNAELYPFDLISDSTNNTAQFNLQIPQSFRACLGGVSGSILDLFGGEYEWDNLTVRHHARRGQDNGVRISYGKNLTDIKQEESIENMHTAVMPYAIQQYGESSETIVGELQTIIQSEQPRVLNLDLSEYFDQDTTITPAAINERCRAYIEANDLDKPTVSIDVSFIALWQTEQYKNIAPLERVNLFDTVHVNFEPLNIETTARVTEYTYDILKERYASIHLGNVRSTLAKTIAQTQEQITKESERTLGFMEAAIKKNTDMMTGVSGGHKYIVRDALGRIQEEYWLDTDSIETAVNIRRENLNGIAYSHNGINGPYVSAWMQDGSFTTELMNTLRIYAAQIIGGIIQDAQNNNYWNLDTGEFRLAPGATIGGKTVQTIADDAAASAASGTLNSFVNSVYKNDIESLQDQIDGNITTWYYSYEPTLSNVPASDWKTVDDKNNHIGDLFYNKATGYCYRFMLDGSTYKWIQISDEDISKAMAAASNAQDTADNKRRVFTAQPVPPYDVGDLWCVGASGDILTCTTAKASGAYAASDWKKLNKYTDDSAVTALDNKLNSPEEIFNRLTNNGAIQGIIMEDGKLYINAEYIKAGILSGFTLDFNLASVPTRLSGGQVSMYDYVEQETKTIRGVWVHAKNEGDEYKTALIASGSFYFYSPELPARIATLNNHRLDITFGDSKRHIDNRNEKQDAVNPGLYIANDMGGSSFINLADDSRIAIQSGKHITIHGDEGGRISGPTTSVSVGYTDENVRIYTKDGSISLTAVNGTITILTSSNGLTVNGAPLVYGPVGHRVTAQYNNSSGCIDFFYDGVYAGSAKK